MKLPLAEGYTRLLNIKSSLSMMINKDPVFNIVYPLIVIVTALLGALSALAAQWNAFFFWVILLSALIGAIIIMNGKKPEFKWSWLKLPDLSKIKLPRLRKKNEKKQVKKAEPKKKKAGKKNTMAKKMPADKKGKQAKPRRSKKHIKVYENKEEETLPKPIEPKTPELKIIELKKQEKKSEAKAKKVETEFDQFINMVKQKKEVGLEEIERKFNISKEKAEEWARMLESHGLVEIRYPTFGEPRLIYKEPKGEL